MTKSHTIGHLARAAGVNVETIRYYQRLGIINEPAKPLDGYRTYPADTVERILFIRRAKELGFKLKEIAELLDLGEGNCSDVRQRAEAKRTHIEKQIKDLQNLKNTLDTLINACLSDSVPGHCPIVDALAKHE